MVSIPLSTKLRSTFYTWFHWLYTMLYSNHVVLRMHNCLQCMFSLFRSYKLGTGVGIHFSVDVTNWEDVRQLAVAVRLQHVEIQMLAQTLKFHWGRNVLARRIGVSCIQRQVQNYFTAHKLKRCYERVEKPKWLHHKLNLTSESLEYNLVELTRLYKVKDELHLKKYSGKDKVKLHKKKNTKKTHIAKSKLNCTWTYCDV